MILSNVKQSIVRDLVFKNLDGSEIVWTTEVDSHYGRDSHNFSQGKRRKKNVIINTIFLFGQ